MSDGTNVLMSWYNFSEHLGPVEAKAEEGPVVICAGRGMGKTLMLHALKKRWGAKFYSGRNREESHEVLREFATLPSPRDAAIAFDNLDVSLSFRPGDSFEAMQEVAAGWRRLVQWRNRGHIQKLVFASTIEFSGPRISTLAAAIENLSQRQSYQEISAELQMISTFTLHPWPKAWKAKWCTSFRNQFEECLKGITAVWCEEIRTLTGGHPTLFAPVVTRLDYMLEHKDELGDFEARMLDQGRSHDPELTAEIHVWMEDLLTPTGMAAIRSALRRLRFSADAEERRSYEQLVRIVQAGGEERFLSEAARHGADERFILMEGGLLYRDTDSGMYVVPGEMVRERISRDASIVPDTVTVVPDVAGDDGGTLVAGDLRIGLKGSAWRALLKLWERHGEFVSIAEFGSVGRNSLQRLREELKHKGCLHLLENEYGRGYRLVLSAKIAGGSSGS